jgi:hypothetical protein
MRLLLPTIVHGQAFRKIASMFYTVHSSWGLDSYQTPDSVRISSDTTFSAEIHGIRIRTETAREFGFMGENRHYQQDVCLS